MNYEDYYNVGYNLVQGGFWDNNNNIDMDPMMNNPWDGDFTLQDGSPCIDSGNPDDFYNDPDGSRSDIGAYYFDQSSYSMEFNGESHLRVNNNPSISNFGGELSISAWVKVTGGEGAHRNIISKTSLPQSFALTASDVERFRPHVRSQNGTWYFFDGNTPVEYNVWTHVAFSYSANEGEIRLYVNGQLDGSISVSGSVNNNNADLYIGHNVNGNGNAGNFVGLVDELSLWDRAFSNDDIHSLMNLSLSGEEESLLGYWNFDEESYPIVYDQSSYENHAENINGAGYSTDTPPVMNATLGEFDLLVNGSGSSTVVSYRDALDLTFIHENYTDTIYFEVFLDLNFNGQLDEDDYNFYKNPEVSWYTNYTGVVPVLDQEGLALQEIIEDRNPSSGVTNIQISLHESIDHWMWLWKFVQNTTSFIRAYDHNGNERIVTVHVEGNGSQNFIEGHTGGEYGYLVIEAYPNEGSYDDEYQFPYLSVVGPSGNYHLDVFDSLGLSINYDFYVHDPFNLHNSIVVDYNEHQNSDMNWFENGVNVDNGTYGIDVFIRQLENSMSGIVYINGETVSGGLVDIWSDNDLSLIHI